MTGRNPYEAPRAKMKSWLSRLSTRSKVLIGMGVFAFYFVSGGPVVWLIIKGYLPQWVAEIYGPGWELIPGMKVSTLWVADHLP
jgi:hypothetical protein